MPPGRGHLRLRRHQRPVVDREGLRDGGGPGRQPAARLRARQVHQPQRDGRLRRASRAATSRSRCAPAASSLREPDLTGDRADPLRGARAAADGAVRARANDTAADRLRLDVRDRRCRRVVEDRTHIRQRLPRRRRTGALPPDRRRARAGSRSTASAPRSTPTPGCRTRDHSWGVRYDVGAAAHRRGAAGGGVARPIVPVRLEPGADGASRRQPLRRSSCNFDHVSAPRLQQRTTHRVSASSTPTAASSASSTSSPTSPTTRSTGGCSGGRLDVPHGRRLAAAADDRGRCPTPASTSAPGSTSGSTATTTANGAARCIVDGERIADCTDAENARRLHQIRDTVVRVTDPVGGGVGVGQLAARHGRQERTPGSRGARLILVSGYGPTNSGRQSAGKARSIVPDAIDPRLIRCGSLAARAGASSASIRPACRGST